MGVGRHDLRRVDDQLIAQAGRQGEPGSSRFFLSRKDELVRNATSSMKKEKRQQIMGGDVVESRTLSAAIAQAQATIEEGQFDIRLRLEEAEADGG